MLTVAININDILPTIQKLMAKGISDDMIITLIRDEHGPGYGAVVYRAIRKMRVESVNVKLQLTTVYFVLQ